MITTTKQYGVFDSCTAVLVSPRFDKKDEALMYTELEDMDDDHYHVAEVDIAGCPISLATA